MADKERPRVWTDHVITPNFAGEAPGPRHVQITTLSGRVFKYAFTDYPIGPDETPESAMATAKRVFREKYRYCEWDQTHPNVDVEGEIVKRIVNFVLWQSKQIKDWKASKPRKFAYWGILLDGAVVEEYPFPDQAKAEQRIRELDSKSGRPHELRRLIRTESDELK